MMKENVILIKEINDLRKEVTQLLVDTKTKSGAGGMQGSMHKTDVGEGTMKEL